MQICFIDIDNLKIAYIEKNPEALQTIFFIHGNSVSKNCWRKQLDSESLKNYRLIAFDLPGHGDSDKAENYNEVYTLKGFAAIAVNIIKALQNNKPYIIAGLSLGTNILTEMLAYTLQPSGIVLAGPSIVSKTVTPEKFIKPNTQVNVVFTEDGDINNVALYAKETSLSDAEEDFQVFMNDYAATDKKVRSVIAGAVVSGDYSDEIALLKQSNVTCLIIFGKDEKIIDPNYLDDVSMPLWENTIFKLEGASHLVNIDKPQEFNKLMADFTRYVF